MVSAYSNYATENKGKLMPGYIDVGDIVVPPAAPPAPGSGQVYVNAKFESGNPPVAADLQSYVWRLSPYLDHSWKTFFTDYRSSGYVSNLTEALGNGSAAAITEIADHPAYGLNSIFLGGDSTHGPFTNLAPWKPGVKPIAATALSQVKNPPRMIVFAPTQSPPPDFPNEIAADDPTGTLRWGFPELRAPALYDDLASPVGGSYVQQWILDPNDGRIKKELTMSEPAGVPIDRLDGNRIPIGHLDGSTEAPEISEIFHIDQSAADSSAARSRLLSYWSPFVISQN
jgi:hypothetical protein